MRKLFFTFLFILGLPSFLYSLEIDFDSELSERIMLRGDDVGVILEIENVTIFDFGIKQLWPSVSELNLGKKIFKTDSYDDISLLVSTLRKNGENIRSEPLIACYGILIRMKDGRLTYIKLNVHKSGVYIASYPSKNEFGSLGFPNNLFLDYLIEKGLVTGAGLTNNGVTH